MKISAKIDYACKALLELSLHWPSESPLAMNYIAGRQDIPLQFLTQILIALKQLGYVDSIRGKNGGYLLARSPADIPLDQLMADLGGEGLGSELDGNLQDGNVIDAIWQELDSVVVKHLKALNFEIICERVRSQQNIVSFDI